MTQSALDSRANILKAALQLFLQKGYKNASFQDLVKKTGLSKGAIYYYFNSKEDLLVSTFEFLLEATRQPEIPDPQKEVIDLESFKKLFVDAKMQQFKSFKKILGTKSLKFNKLLFFLEAINENEKLKKIIMQLLNHETIFLEKCFLALQRHGKLPREKSPSLLAESLFWMLQGAEMITFFVNNNNEQEEDFIRMYTKTINDFFKII